MKKLIPLLLILASEAAATTINRSSNPQLYPTMDPIIAYQQNELTLAVRLPYHTNLSSMLNYTVAAYTNAQLLETFLPTNLYGTLTATSPVATVTYVIPESDMTMPPQQYMFEGRAGSTLLFSTVLDVKPSGGTNIIFNGPYYGPYNTVYVAGRGWIPFNQATNGVPTLAQVLAEGGSTDISGLTGYLAANLVGAMPGATEFSTNGTVIGSGAGINLIGNWPGSYFSGGIMNLMAAGGGGNTYISNQYAIVFTAIVEGTTFVITNYFNIGDTIVSGNTYNVTADSVIAGDVNASGNVNLLGSLYAYFTNVFAPVLNFSITNIINVGSIENTITNIVNNSNIVNMVNNIGGVQVFTSNDVSYGWAGGTGTPAFVRIYNTSGNIATGGMDGANLDLYVGGSGNGDSYPIAGVYPVGVTNYQGTSYVYLVSSGGIVIQPSIYGTNVLQFGGPTSIFYSVPVDKNLIIVDSWTAAGGGTLGGAGSHSEIYIPVVGGEMLEFIVGEAGLNILPTNASGFSTVRGGWPNGGSAVSRLNYPVGSGAGYNAIKRGAIYIYVGGGGAGGTSAVQGGAGGGVSGANGAGSVGLGGYGGNQTDSGIAPTSSVLLAVTNTAGDFLVGGDSGSTTNLQAGAASGGGAGFRGGSGGLAIPGANSRGTGGGGSSWANTNLVIYFSTTRGVGSTPPKQELPWYGSDTRGIGWGACVGTNGGNAGMVIREATL